MSEIPSGIHVLAKPMGAVCNLHCDYCMNPGDHVVLFSDALYEIADTTGKQLGVERLIDIFKECDWPRSGVDFKEIERRFLVFSNLIRFKDDFTLLDIGMASSLKLRNSF